jgi:hypothetical protein
MWAKPTKEMLGKLPALGSSAHMLAAEKVIYIHFFLGDSDWYAAEFDGDDTFFGFAIINGDDWNAEWGYFSLSELSSIRDRSNYEVDADMYWEPKPAGQIENIKKCWLGGCDA